MDAMGMAPIIGVVVGFGIVVRIVYNLIRRRFGVNWALGFAGLMAVGILWAVFPKSTCACMDRQTGCAANVKQLGLGMIQYVQDYDEKWPGGDDHWAGAIYPYEKSTSVYICPNDKRHAVGNLNPISYAMNENLRGHGDDAAANPSSTVLAAEFDGSPLCDQTQAELLSPYTLGTTPNTAWGGVRLGTTSTLANPPRHGAALMLLACDGHVKLLRPENVSSGTDNPSLPGTQDSIHAAGTGQVGPGHRYMVTFSEM